MVSEQDHKIIISYARQYGVKELYLFGSSLDQSKISADIDLAVNGLSPPLFFNFYGKLLRHLSKPVDLVYLSRPSRFTESILPHALKIYG